MKHRRKDFLRTEIVTANAFIADPQIKDEKYHAMKQSPFQFYRATDHLYYSDLSNGTISIPDTWKLQPHCSIWLSGDFHTQNIGYANDRAGKVIFDLNDADESYIGPFYWDLLRFSTSLYLLLGEINKTHLPHGGDTSYSIAEQESLVAHLLRTYQDTLQLVNGNNDETRIAIDEAHLHDGFVRDKLRTVQRETQADLLKKWTVKTSNGRRFDAKNKNLASVTEEERTALANNWASYQQSLSQSFVASVVPKNSHYFAIKDCARRLHSGLGSLGADKYYVLIEGDNAAQDNEPILEVKEQLLPSLFKEGSSSIAQYNGWFANHAQRSVIATRALGIKVDEHLGVVLFNGKAFRVRRLPPARYSFVDRDFVSKSDVKDFVTSSARVLALAHARSDKDYNADYIDYNFEQVYFSAIAAWPQFKTTLDSLAKTYYQQVLTDHEMFTKLLDTGELAV